ncbi:hypothetical protein F5Y13DRAFT_204644 [Hypoxylon sp. FL1857]|nr:hypothetical protein F5Y13DRAFT_204644 [Hypoxylon sp. FL1857]
MDSHTDYQHHNHAVEPVAENPASRLQASSQEQLAQDINARTSSDYTSPSGLFLTTTGTYLPRPVLILTSRDLNSHAIGNQPRLINNTAPKALSNRIPPIHNISTTNYYNTNIPIPSTSDARMGRSTNHSLPWGVHNTEVEFPPSAQLNHTYLPLGPQNGTEAQEEPQRRQQKKSTVGRVKTTMRRTSSWSFGIFPAWGELNTVQNKLYAIIGMALASVIASVAVLRNQHNLIEGEWTTIWLWAIVSVVILVFLLAFNNHRDAQLQECGGAYRYTHRWVELGDLDDSTAGISAALRHHNSISYAHHHSRGDSLPLTTHMQYRQIQFDEPQAPLQASATLHHGE